MLLSVKITGGRWIDCWVDSSTTSAWRLPQRPWGGPFSNSDRVCVLCACVCSRYHIVHCTLCSTAGSRITVNGKECLNLATLNFLGFLENSSVKVWPHLCLLSNSVSDSDVCFVRKLLLGVSVSMALARVGPEASMVLLVSWLWLVYGAHPDPPLRCAHWTGG